MNNTYLDEALWIYNLVIKHYTDSDGMLVNRVDALTGQVVDDNILVSDFGDYIQNFYYLGILTGRKDICEWSIEHIIKASQRYQHPCGFFYTSRDKTAVQISDNADTFEGLSTLYLLSEDERILQIIDKFIDGIDKTSRQSGFVPEQFGSLKGILCSRPDYTGNFAEELLFLYEKSGRKAYLKIADRIIQSWIGGDCFKKHHLLPNRAWRNGLINKLMSPLACFYNSKSFSTVYLGKANCNFLSAVLQYWRLTSDSSLKQKLSLVIDEWLSAVESKSGESGYYHGLIDLESGEISNYRRSLPANHRILAFLADAYFYIQDQSYLDLLEKGCRFWLKKQTDIGFFPESPASLSDDDPQRAIMDSNLDLSIVLLKAFCLTGKQEYLLSAKSCIEAIIKYMKVDFGYTEMVDTKTGELHVHGKNYVKYLTLFIKGLLLLERVINNRNLFQKELYLISRDR